jgi:hypothetical protein
MKRIMEIAVPLAFLLVTAAAPSQSAPKTAKAPQERVFSYGYDMLDNSVIRPATRALDVARLARVVSGHEREAANVDENDQVRLPSTWWQPRIGFRNVTVAQMMNGPGPGTGPVGRWTVTKAKTQGVTPGFEIKDERGDKYVIKLDPPGAPGLATGPDVIGSRLFWAAGYNVPDNCIAHFRLEQLDISPKATYEDWRGQKKQLTKTYLTEVLAKTDHESDGSYRCLASAYLKGKPLGPFHYNGRRPDDPEDEIPHELRRELRGFWTVCAWLNHADSRGPNTLDMWVNEGGRSFVRHYLIDFGSILGSSATPIERDYSTGSEYYIDYGTMTRNIVTAGLAPPRWENVRDPHIPAVGFIESKEFDAEHWKPDLPNPAFDDRTDRDARWGARIVAGFSDDHIRAAVAMAQYPDPRAAAYLTQVLIERRDKIVAHWLGPRGGPPTLSAR